MISDDLDITASDNDSPEGDGCNKEFRDCNDGMNDATETETFYDCEIDNDFDDAGVPAAVALMGVGIPAAPSAPPVLISRPVITKSCLKNKSIIKAPKKVAFEDKAATVMMVAPSCYLRLEPASLRRPRGTLISVHHPDYRHKDGLTNLGSMTAERWARRQASSLSLECASLDGTSSAAAAVGRDISLRWIADTGSAFDLIKEDDVVRRGVTVRRQLPSKRQVTLTTANGKTKVGTVAPMEVPVLGRISPLMLKETPAAITVGQRCMDKGWAFHWPSGQSPYMVDPDGRIIPLVVENYVPYLYEDDMDDRKSNDSEGEASSKSTASAASIETASSSSTSSYGKSPSENEWGRVGWDPYNTDLAADEKIVPPAAATPAPGRSPWASSAVGGGCVQPLHVGRTTSTACGQT